MVTFLLLTFSCSDHENVIQKECIYQLSEYPDSSFIGDVKCLQYSDNHLYLLDINRRSVIRFDKSLSSFQAISTGGRASKELLNPFSFIVSRDSLFVIDFGGHSMKTFHNGEFIGENQVPLMIRDQRFVKLGNVFYFPYKDSEASIICMSKDSPPIKVLDTEWYSNQTKTVTMNVCNVLSFDENLVIVPEALPWVKIINTDGQIIRTIDLAQSSFYKKNISYAKRADGEEKSFYQLNCDACIRGEELLILIPNYCGNYECNRILSVNLNNGLIAKEMIQLKNLNYSSLCSDGMRIYTFNNIENRIEVYEL